MGKEMAMMPYSDGIHWKPSTSARLCLYINSLAFDKSGWFAFYIGGDVVILQCERTDISSLVVDKLLPIW